MIIVGSADHHVDSTMVGSWDGQAGVHSNWLESFARVQDLVDLCNDRKADLLLVAGDVFHNGRPSAEAVHRYVNIMSGLKNTKVIFTDGNHDQTSVLGNHKTPIGAYLANQPWTFKTSSYSEVIQFDGVSIAAIPWHRVAGENSLEQTSMILRDDVNRMEDIVAGNGGPSFLFGHFTVDEATIGGGKLMRSSEMNMSTSALEATLGVDQLDKGPWSFWRAGHIHRHQYLGEKGGYFGSTYKVSFNEQDEQKGAEVIELNDDGTYSYEFVPFVVRELTSITMTPGVDLIEHVVDAQKERDILRLMFQAEDSPTAKTEKLIKSLRSKNVEVQIRHLPKDRINIRNIQVSIDTDPVSAMKTYSETNIEDEGIRSKANSMFKDVLGRVS